MSFPHEVIMASMRPIPSRVVQVQLNHFQKRLEGKLLEVLEGNPSADVPYHNNKHMKGVWDIGLIIWDAEKEDIGLGSDWATIALMFVCLLHDYGHSAGKDNDHYNVLSTREFVSELIAKHGYSLPGRVIEVIDKAIECTEFPFVIPPRNKLEKVMRDADVLYATVSLDPTIVMEDLRAEIQVAAKREITYAEMLEGQADFMEKAELFTETGRVIWDIYAPRYLVRLQDYVKEKETPDV